MSISPRAQKNVRGGRFAGFCVGSPRVHSSLSCGCLYQSRCNFYFNVHQCFNGITHRTHTPCSCGPPYISLTNVRRALLHPSSRTQTLPLPVTHVELYVAPCCAVCLLADPVPRAALGSAPPCSGPYWPPWAWRSAPCAACGSAASRSTRPSGRRHRRTGSRR